MKSRRQILGSVLCLALMGTAGAATLRTNLAAPTGGNFGVVGNALAFSQSFQDTIQFSLAGGALPLGNSTFADLTPGRYTVAVFGTARYLSGYAPSYRVAGAAVPEFETWLMLLIGVMLAAYQLHRKQKSLGQQVLSDEALSSA